MSPATHFLTGWLVANGPRIERRDRAIIAVAAIIPDADALGIVAEVTTRGSETPLLWWSQYHHVLGHNLTFCLLCTLLAFAIAQRRCQTAILTFFTFHLHLLCDIIGGQGPDGDQWPIHYLYPFSEALQITWSGQWKLNAWPNFLITGIALALTCYLAWRRGFSPLEMVSKRADGAFVGALRNRVPRKDAGDEG